MQKNCFLRGKARLYSRNACPYMRAFFLPSNPNFARMYISNNALPGLPALAKSLPYYNRFVLPEAQRDLLEVVLVSPRNPLNIGAAARAMANFGLHPLLVVADRRGT